MTSTINISDIGQPTPNGWQVQQVQIGGKMFVKLVIASPTGIDVHFMDGDQAQQVASNLRKAGRSVIAGIWTPGVDAPVASSGPEEPVGGNQAAGPISGTGADLSGQ